MPDGLDERPGDGAFTISDIWIATLGQLSAQLNRSTYVSWVEGAKPVSYADGILTVRARHFMAREWLSKRLNHIIEETVSSLAQRPITIQYILDLPSPPAPMSPQDD
jgi:chromosomal replication initiation ATPase DnaA